MTKDLLGTGESAKAVEKGTREIRSLIERFLGPIADESGEFVADKIRIWRHRKAFRTLLDAEKMVEESVKEIQQVSPKILVPLLEESSLEDDEDLRSKWAGLLASAAAGDEIPPSYPKY